MNPVYSDFPGSPPVKLVVLCAEIYFSITSQSAPTEPWYKLGAHRMSPHLFFKWGNSFLSTLLFFPHPPRNLQTHTSRIHSSARQQPYHWLLAHRTQVIHHIRHSVVQLPVIINSSPGAPFHSTHTLGLMRPVK